MEFKIGNKSIGDKHTTFIIAEMSANHNGDISNAYNIIKMAKKCGADALKMQTYTPDTLTLNCDFSDFQLTDGLWSGQSLYQLYQSAFFLLLQIVDLFQVIS